MKDPSYSVSVVIPVYRSEECLPALIERLEPVLKHHFEQSEIVLVNDGSPDASWGMVLELKKRHPSIVGLSLTRNFGQHNALLAGILAAQNDILVTMDDDLQNPPEEIPRLVEKLGQGYDLVYGVRFREQHGLMRNLCSRLTKWFLQHGFGISGATSITSFRAFRRDLTKSFQSYSGPFVFIDFLLCWGTTCIASVVVRHEARKSGASNYSWPRLVSHGLNMITSFSTFPLRLAVWLGFLVTLIGILLFAVVILAYFFSSVHVPGFTFLAAGLTLFSGTQLFVLGMLGEYLARIYMRSMGCPAYVIRERI